MTPGRSNDPRQEGQSHAGSSRGNPDRSAFARLLDDIEETDDIGLLEAISQALEQLEICEAADQARYDAQERAVFERSRIREEEDTDHDEHSTQQEDASKLQLPCPSLNEEQNDCPVRKNAGSERETRDVDSGSEPGEEIPEDAGNSRQSERQGLSTEVPNTLEDQVETLAPFGARGHILFSKRLANYFATVASTQEKRVVAVTAWGVSVLALIIVLIFVTLDFLSSRKSATTAMKLEVEEEIDLPEVYICNRQLAFPPFLNLPNETFPGEPITWVHSLQIPENKSRIIFYPEAHKHPNVDQITINSRGERCSSAVAEFADASIFSDALPRPPRCFHCIRLRNSPPISVKRHDTERQGPSRSMSRENEGSSVGSEIGGGILAQNSGVTMTVSQNLLIESCRRTRAGLEHRAYLALRNSIIANAQAIQNRGIMDFGGIDPESESGATALFPKMRFPPRYTYADYVCGDVIDAICNTVLFSGFFYPSPPAQDVRYKFNTTTERWERSGLGPYFPTNFTDLFVAPRLREDGTIQPGQTVIGLLTGSLSLELTPANYTKSDVAAATSLHVYLRDEQEGDALRQVAAVRETGRALIDFSKEIVNNQTRFTAKSEFIELYTVDGRNANENYFITLTVTDFTTRVVSEQVTVQFSSFLADFFGLIELFLDLSVYTLIVSPIVVATRRRALLARARAHAANQANAAGTP